MKHVEPVPLIVLVPLVVTGVILFIFWVLLFYIPVKLFKRLNMSLSLKPHIRAATREGQVERVIPYLVMNDEHHADLFLQNGKAYGAGGDLIKKIPKWAEDKMKAMNPKALEEVGWKWPQ